MDEKPPPSSEIVLNGIPAAPGIAIGKVHIYRHDELSFREYTVESHLIERELVRLNGAIDAARVHIRTLRERLAGIAGDGVARIFEVQESILQDEEYLNDIRQIITKTHLNAEVAVRDATRFWSDQLSSLEGEMFRQRVHDLKDVGSRMVKYLLGTTEGAIKGLDQPKILVAEDLLPSDVIHLLSEQILAVATDLGGSASHTAILTRALEVPAVVGLKEISHLIENNSELVVNGNSGKVILFPTPITLSNYHEKRHRYLSYRSSLKDIRSLPAETLDGKRISLKCNIELPQEVRSVISHGGEGIGLFRSEYLFLANRRLPDEEDQFNDYRRVLEAVAPHSVTIRTYDLGGDRVFPDLPHPAENNPVMGWRAIRVAFDHPKLLTSQLRAILRAAKYGNAQIMFPFVSGLQDLKMLKSILLQVQDELAPTEGDYVYSVPIGVMIELPSAVLTSDYLAKEVDFFSIGTNDLTQFTLAVDRGNERVSPFYRPLHPAILRMIKMTVDASHARGIKTALCGELGANPAATMLLVGLGIDELSVSPFALPEVKKLIRSMSYKEAQNFANQVLQLHTESEIFHFCSDQMKRRFADLPIWFNG